MKRSGQVGLALMGAAAFAGTFAAGVAYFAWQKPSHAAEAQSAQSCTQRTDGPQNCEPARRGFAYFVYPRWVSGWSWGTSVEPPSKTQSAALSGNSRSYAPSGDGTAVRGGFGSMANGGQYRVSAGG